MKERSIFFNSAWGVFSQLFRGAIALALIPFVISRVGLAHYGLFSSFLLLSLYQGLLALLDLGYPAFLLNQIAREPGDRLTEESRRRLDSLATYLFLVTSALLVLGWFFSSVFLQWLHVDPSTIDTYRRPFFIILFSNLFSVPLNICGVIWIGKHRNAQFKQIETTGYFIFVLLTFILLSISPDFINLTIAFLVSQILMALSVLVLSFRNFQYWPRLGSLRFKHFKEEWPTWSPFFFSRVNGTAQRQSDVTLVSFILGPAAVAIYDICLKIPSLLKGLIGRISEVITPVASLRRDVQYNTTIRSLAESLCNMQMTVVILFLVAYVFFARQFVAFWLGAEYTNHISTFWLAGLLALVAPHNSVLGSILIARGDRSRAMSTWPTSISFCSILLSLPLTWVWGVKGTIFATLLQFFLIGVLFIGWARKDFDFKFSSGFRSWLIAIVISGGLHAVTFSWISEINNVVRFFVWFVLLEILILGLVGFSLKTEIRKTISQLRVKASSITMGSLRK